MIVDELEIERVLARFEALKAAIVDSSSIIYIEKAGFYGDLAVTIRLMTIPPVLKGVGMPGLEIQIVQADRTAIETDRQLVSTAGALRKPLISDDRAILLKCKAKGIEYYNAYMMLLLLRLRLRIDVRDFQVYRKRLVDISHYGNLVLDYADSFTAYLDKAI